MRKTQRRPRDSSLWSQVKAYNGFWKFCDRAGRKTPEPFGNFMQILSKIGDHGTGDLMYRNHWIRLPVTWFVGVRSMQHLTEIKRHLKHDPRLAELEARASGRLYAELVTAIRPIYKKIWPYRGRLVRALNNGRMKKAFLEEFSKRTAVLIGNGKERVGNGSPTRLGEVKRIVADLNQALKPRKSRPRRSSSR